MKKQAYEMPRVKWTCFLRHTSDGRIPVSPALWHNASREMKNVLKWASRILGHKLNILVDPYA